MKKEEKESLGKEIKAKLYINNPNEQKVYEVTLIDQNGVPCDLEKQLDRRGNYEGATWYLYSDFQNSEDLAEQLHLWYLEATKGLNPKSYNPQAQKSYQDLTEEQREIDRFIAGKILSLLQKQKEEVIGELKKFTKIKLPRDDSEIVNYKTGYNQALDDIISALKEKDI
jgi:hypothetical protein